LPVSHFTIFPFHQYFILLQHLHKMDNFILEKNVISGPFFIDLDCALCSGRFPSVCEITMFLYTIPRICFDIYDFWSSAFLLFK
jgi:hypothetical protein